jgi:hypothetical protein
VTAVEQVAQALAARFAILDAPAMLRVPTFRAAAADALHAAGSVDRVVDEVGALGALTGARWPHRLLVARLRQVPELLADRARLAAEAAEVARWAAVDRAVHRGASLRVLVDRGDLFAGEAATVLRSELPDDDLRAVALAALTGGRS